MKGLKGATILAEVISFIFLIITGYALTGTIIFAYGVSATEQILTGDNLEYTMTMTAGYLPVQNEVALLGMLETDCASTVCTDMINTLTLTPGWNNGVLIPELEKLKVSEAPDCIIGIQGQDASGNWFLLAPEKLLEPNIQYNMLTTSSCTWFGGNIPMKKVITECLIQKTAKPYIHGVQITTKEAIETLFSNWQTEKYLVVLRMGDGNMIDLAGTTSFGEQRETGEIVRFQKISSEVFSPFETGFLELYVFSEDVSD